ncbi:unnamed protein product [Arctogadus glacialis]
MLPFQRTGGSRKTGPVHRGDLRGIPDGEPFDTGSLHGKYALLQSTTFSKRTVKTPSPKACPVLFFLAGAHLSKMRTRRCVHITEVVLEYVQGNVLPGDRFPDDLPLNSFTPLTTPARTDGQPVNKSCQSAAGARSVRRKARTGSPSKPCWRRNTPAGTRTLGSPACMFLMDGATPRKGLHEDSRDPAVRRSDTISFSTAGIRLRRVKGQTVSVSGDKGSSVCIGVHTGNTEASGFTPPVLDVADNTSEPRPVPRLYLHCSAGLTFTEDVAPQHIHSQLNRTPKQPGPKPESPLHPD